MLLHTVRDVLLHVLLPKTCFGCKRDLPFNCKVPLCAACLEEVKAPGPFYCQRCGVLLKDGGAHCFHCRGNKKGKFKCKIIRSALLFTPPVRNLTHAFKYSSYTFLADFLSVRMAACFKKYPELAEAQLLVPVPLHQKKRKKRGYNQSALLTQKLSEALKIPFSEAVLIRTRPTPSQTAFGREQRLQNVKDAFECVNVSLVKGKTILLIDDVATTGATLEACAEALVKNGAAKVLAYTLCRE